MGTATNRRHVLVALLAVVLIGAGAVGIWAVSARQPTPPAVPVPGDWTLLPDGARAIVTEAVAACRARPDDAAAFAMLGRIYHGNSEPALAIAAYERALALGTDEARTPYLLGLLYEDWGRTDQAIDRLRLALARDAGYAPAWFHLGRNLLDAGDVQASIDASRHAVEIEPASATFHAGLGGALRQAGLLEQAVESLQQALAIDPDHPAANQLMGLTLRARGNHTRADAHLARMRVYWAQVVSDPWLRQTQQYATSVETRLEWARSLIRAGRLQSAQKLLQTLANEHPDRAEVFRRLGEVFARNGRADLAMSAYERAVELDPYDGSTHNALAESLLLTGDLARADLQVSRALAINPDDIDALVIQAAILLRGGAAAEASQRLEALTAARGDHVAGHYWLGQALMSQERYQDAARVYERLVELRPDLVSAQEQLALAHRKLSVGPASDP